jgi:sulfur relay (sulfurtransferase) DsrC/TusE family protein
MRPNTQSLNTNIEFFIHDYQNELDLKQYVNLFQSNGITDKSQEIVVWQHVNNPGNNIYISFAIEKNNTDCAALYTIFPVRFKYFDSTFEGAQSIDTITDLKYRGKGLFIMLAKHLYSKALNQGIQFIYGFPNKNSISGFLKKLNWVEVADVPFLIKPLRPKYFLRFLPVLKHIAFLFPDFSFQSKRKSASLKNYQIKSIQTFDQSIDQVWETFSKKINIAVHRSQSYMHWRITQKPNGDYITYGLYSDDNKLCAVISYTIKKKHNGTIGYIMDYFYEYEHEKPARELIKKVMDEMNAQKVDAVLAWCFKHSPNYSHYKESGFYYMPTKIRPIELHFGTLDMAGNFQGLSKKENWYISYLDSDTI